MGHEGSNPLPSADGSMVKWKSYLASNEMVQVQLLVELLIERLNAMEGLPRPIRRPCRSVPATGTGWKPVER